MLKIVSQYFGPNYNDIITEKNQPDHNHNDKKEQWNIIFEMNDKSDQLTEPCTNQDYKQCLQEAKQAIPYAQKNGWNKIFLASKTEKELIWQNSTV